MECRSRCVGRHEPRHGVPVELLEPSRVIGVPDDVKGRVVVVFDVRQQARLTQIREDELQVPQVGLRQRARWNVECPPHPVQRERFILFRIIAVGQHAADLEACVAAPLKAIQLMRDEQRGSDRGSLSRHVADARLQAEGRRDRREENESVVRAFRAATVAASTKLHCQLGRTAYPNRF